jgi:hypothetical protein
MPKRARESVSSSALFCGIFCDATSGLWSSKCDGVIETGFASALAALADLEERTPQQAASGFICRLSDVAATAVGTAASTATENSTNSSTVLELPPPLVAPSPSAAASSTPTTAAPTSEPRSTKRPEAFEGLVCSHLLEKDGGAFGCELPCFHDGPHYQEVVADPRSAGEAERRSTRAGDSISPGAALAPTAAVPTASSIAPTHAPSAAVTAEAVTVQQTSKPPCKACAGRHVKHTCNYVAAKRAAEKAARKAAAQARGSAANVAQITMEVCAPAELGEEEEVARGEEAKDDLPLLLISPRMPLAQGDASSFVGDGQHHEDLMAAKGEWLRGTPPARPNGLQWGTEWPSEVAQALMERFVRHPRWGGDGDSEASAEAVCVFGRVAGCNAGVFEISYEDGTEGRLSWTQLRELLVPMRARDYRLDTLERRATAPPSRARRSAVMRDIRREATAYLPRQGCHLSLPVGRVACKRHEEARLSGLYPEDRGPEGSD